MTIYKPPEPTLLPTMTIYKPPEPTLLPTMTIYKPPEPTLLPTMTIYKPPEPTLLRTPTIYKPPEPTLLPTMTIYNPPEPTLLPTMTICKPPEPTLLPTMTIYKPPIPTFTKMCESANETLSLEGANNFFGGFDDDGLEYQSLGNVKHDRDSSNPLSQIINLQLANGAWELTSAISNMVGKSVKDLKMPVQCHAMEI
ncbi:pollen-specific leucine-rich repeat extensin-like protein 3 isoform X4 [Xenia sp. Carnegie-2017]|uniref:pollen-specific leucine-rich repeat extensin-like protein 3 isoform X4 n=1 Tax=Xenia sp. Carnegie-2017 TaxID=2897299 RepID=UPI001F042A4F|nr:pollen-specific leucine-rich repeat extensin-like protein 3 isoform X4 [Xenia sp. Carnegie-2017]